METYSKTSTIRVERAGDLFCIWEDEAAPFFVHKSTYKPHSMKIRRDYDWFKAIPHDERFHLYGPAMRTFVMEGGLWLDSVRNCADTESLEPLRFEEIPEELDRHNILRVDWGSYILWAPGQKIPVSSPRTIQLSSARYKMSAVMERLKADPRVTVVDNRTFLVLFPQDQYDTLWDHFSDPKHPGNYGYPDSCIWDSIRYAGLEGVSEDHWPDILNIGEFRIPEDEDDDDDCPCCGW